PTDDPGALPGIPVTIAWGTRDVVLLHRTQSARARAVLPFAQHVDLPHCGHLPFSDDPAACTRLVLSDARTAG
ncbi:MAG TPA: alpha/beta hydrolase, partial [Nocardioides sp.]|nr:alpha/beta hydrolase [Nocardioides sp.]